MFEDNDQDELVTDDQTQFGLESPLFTVPRKSKPESELTPEEITRQKRQRLLIGLGIGLLILLMVLVVVAALMKPRVSKTLTPDASSTPVPHQQLSPLEQKVDTLRKDLRLADPTRQDLPFPPVDLEIQLDTIKKE